MNHVTSLASCKISLHMTNQRLTPSVGESKQIYFLILIPFLIGLVTLIQSSSVLAHKHESTNHLVLPTTEEEEKEELPPSWSDSLGLQYDQLFQVHIKKTKSLLFCSVNTKSKKFVDITQQCFAFTPQANFPAYNLNFH